MITFSSNERFAIHCAVLTRIDFIKKMIAAIPEDCNLKKMYSVELDSLNALLEKLSNPA